MYSGARFIAPALTFRFGVGHEPEDPKNTICMVWLPNDRRRLTPLGRAFPLVYVQVPSRPRTPSREMNLDARRKESRGTNAMRSSRTVSFRRWRWTWVPASFP